MAKALRAEDVETAARTGAKEIGLEPGQVMTPLSRDRARELGIEVRDSSGQARQTRDVKRPRGSATKTLRIVGVADGVYYAPQIVASNLGFYRQEGLEIEYVGQIDPEGLARAVTEGRFDFALGGLWRPMLFAELGQPYVAFAHINMQCDILVFARVPADEFDWTSLEGRSVLFTSVGAPSPWFALQELFRNRGVDLNAVHMIPGLPPSEARNWFKSGFADLIEASDVEAAPLIADPGIHQIATWRTDIGSVPWSVYYTTPEGLRDREDDALALTRGLHRGQQWIHEHTAEEITEVVAPDFPQLSTSDVHGLVATYLDQHLWPTSPLFVRESVERWIDILTRCGLLSRPISYREIVDPTVSSRVVGQPLS